MFNFDKMESSGKPVTEEQKPAPEAESGSEENNNNAGAQNQEQGSQGAAETDEEKAAREQQEAAKSAEQQQQSSGAGAGLTDEEKKAEEQRLAEENANKIKTEALAQLFKRFGVNSEQELDAKLNPVVETDEEKKAKSEIYTASLNKFAVEQKIFTNEELVAFENMRNAPDDKLVFSAFEKEYRELNKDRKSEDGNIDPVTDDEVRDKFNELYHIDSESAALKNIGKKNLETAAKAIREPLLQKYQDIKEEFDEDSARRAAIPKFKEFIKGVVSTMTPDKIELEDGVVFDLGQVDKDAIEKMLITNPEFENFRQNGATDEQRNRLQKEIFKEVLYNNYKQMAKVVGDVRYDQGQKAGAIGGNKPFDEQQRNSSSGAAANAIDEKENTRIAKAFAGV
jgi:hypothetical protein